MNGFDGNFKSMVDQINNERKFESVDEAADDNDLIEDSEEQEEVEPDNSDIDEDNSSENEDEESGEEDAEADENQDDKTSKGKKEASKKAESSEASLPEFPLYEITKEEVPQYSLEDVYSAWYNDTMQKGVQQLLGEDAKQYKSIDEIAAALGPAAWNRLERNAQAKGQQAAEKYNQEVVQPYQVKATSNAVMQEVNAIVRLPQMKQLPKYLPRMAELLKEYKNDYPSLEDPVRGVPLLYMLAREEELSGTVKKIAKEKQKNTPGFEKGGVDRNITTKKKRDERDEFMEKVKKNKKQPDPLAGIFALPKERMTFNHR